MTSFVNAATATNSNAGAKPVRYVNLVLGGVSIGALALFDDSNRVNKELNKVLCNGDIEKVQQLLMENLKVESVKDASPAALNNDLASMLTGLGL